MVEHRSLAQKRAAYALSVVQEMQTRGKNAYGNYRGAVRALPATIMASGLGQALAMEMAARGRDAGHRLLLEHLSDWLCDRKPNGWGSSPYRGSDNIVGKLVAGTESDYIRAQEEAMALLVWLKKFAEAFLAQPDGSDGK